MITGGPFNPRLGQRIPESSRSLACFQMISKWRVGCLGNHSSGLVSSQEFFTNNTTSLKGWSHSDSILPTRVVDIGEGSIPPRILVTTGQRDIYTTLSYCWGQSKQLPITTSANLALREKHIHPFNLPPVFQDAITIIRKLGYRYIWIDALCILQDSSIDWNIESSRMDQYYMGSSLNIIAAAAKDPYDGIFDAADYLRTDYKYGAKDNYGWSAPNPVGLRAWTLQEENLSPRSLIYTGGFLTWLCNHQSAVEVRPSNPVTNGYCLNSIIPKPNKLLFHLLENTNQIRKDNNAFAWWYGILNDYARRNISYIHDRLPGIVGLAKLFERRVKVHYVCGLWREDLGKGLCWRAYGSRIPYSKYLGPSWSWISLDNHHLGSKLVYEQHLYGFEVPGRNAFELVDVHVLHEGNDSYGPIKMAVLFLHSPTRKLRDLPPPIESGSGKSDSDDMIKCTLDELAECQNGTPIIAHSDFLYIQIGRWSKTNGAEEVLALILEPTGGTHNLNGKHNEYRRVGIAKFPNNADLTEGWSKETVAII